MAEKSANLSWVLRLNPIINWWFKILVLGFFLGFLIVWGNDAFNTVSQTTNSSTDDLLEKPNHQKIDSNLTHEEIFASQNPTKNSNDPPSSPKIVPWITASLEANYSSHIMSQWLAKGGENCKGSSRTVDIQFRNFDNNGRRIELSTGDIHEIRFQSVDESGDPLCLGGDYFEVDLSGERWKSRPPVKDLGNGTYVISLQVHPDFAGEYNLTIILLFRHYEGLKFSPPRFAFDRVLRSIPIEFVESRSLPDIARCGKKSDYAKDVWSGRWTRHARNDTCPIDEDGRYRCQEPGFSCPGPWCAGPLGALESNGWVYSAHCSFKMFTGREAWDCLSGRWIFWWGDSNHCDTIRNVLHFVLGIHDIPLVSRIFDRNVTNPNDPAQTVRLTSVFNGHPNDTGNYQGLNSLTDARYRETLKGYFSGETVPDTIVMNSGLHDGVFWPTIRSFVKGADFAAQFWAEVVRGVGERGLARPEVVYRTTVATGGYARSLAFNPQKMEAFNGVVLDWLRAHGVVDRVVDGFDMTFPWHYDNRCNDGVHYGRAPSKTKWRDGLVGHQYFVDLMLGHVLFNAMCVDR